MNDTTPAPASDLTSAQRAIVSNDMTANNLTPEQIQAELTRGTTPDLSQAQPMREAMTKAGHSEREILTALARHGLGEAPPLAIVPIPGHDPAASSEFNQTPVRLADGTEVGRTLRAAFEALGLSKEMGNALLNETARSMGHPMPTNDAERKMRTAAVTSQLRQHWKDYSEHPARLELLKQTLDEVEEIVPGFRVALDATNASTNFQVLVQLGEHVQRVRNAKHGPGGYMETKAKAAETKRRAGHASALIFD